MRTVGWFAAWTVLLCWVSALQAGTGEFEYPSALRDAYDADDSCWIGMSVTGEYPVPVRPDIWLIGPPLSEKSAVTMPTDHWVELLFSGRIVPADGNDIEVREWGKAGEEAIVFLTDGADQEYAVALAKADLAQAQAVSYIGLDLPEVFTPFAPRGLRLVAVDSGGGAPGFDVASVQARVLKECGPAAGYPDPVDGATGGLPDVTLVWTPACDAADQSLYLSDARSLVESADPSVRLSVLAPDANCFEPNGLALNTTYYWRVDANGAGPADVWSFTTSDHVVIDDFDAYGTSGNYLYETWHTRGKARVGEESQYARHSCPQSMRFAYYYDSIYCSEAYRGFSPPQDWTQAGAQTLVLWVHGLTGNDVQGRMYAVLSDGTTERQVFCDDSGILTRVEWDVWRIPLADFNDVDLSTVASLALGFVFPSAQSGEYGSGTIYVDDVSLYSSLCLDERRPAADLTADCVVDYRDLRQMAMQWLDTRGQVVDVVAPSEPVLWYAFDGDTSDSMGVAHGQVQGRPTFETGVHGRAIHMVNRGDAVTISDVPAVFDRIREAITIAFWQRGDDSAHRNDTLCCSNYDYGRTSPSVAVHLGCWRDPGQYRWDCGTPWSFASRVAGHHRSRSEWTGRWNHWAFTKDIRVGSQGSKGRMQVYLNGVLYDSRSGTDSPIEDIDSFQIGSGWYGHYDGLIDDFQIYDYALSEAEVAYLASDGTGQLPWDLGLAADLDGNRTVEFGDFAILADEWLDFVLVRRRSSEVARAITRPWSPTAQ
jgi:hypothetical protein